MAQERLSNEQQPSRPGGRFSGKVRATLGHFGIGQRVAAPSSQEPLTVMPAFGVIGGGGRRPVFAPERPVVNQGMDLPRGGVIQNGPETQQFDLPAPKNSEEARARLLREHWKIDHPQAEDSIPAPAEATDIAPTVDLLKAPVPAEVLTPTATVKNGEFGFHPEAPTQPPYPRPVDHPASPPGGVIQ